MSAMEECQPSRGADTACDCIVLQCLNSGIFPNISRISPVYLAQAVLHSVDLPISFVGMILSLVLICRKKTNFLVRVFVYSTFPLTQGWIQGGGYWGANPTNSQNMMTS